VNPAAQPPVRAYIGLGSNLNDPVEQVRSARRTISQINGVEESGFSSLYRSPPMGPADQPDYVNAVLAVTTILAPLALLTELQAIEAEHGRVRGRERWGPRTLDLDILLYGQRVISTERLTVPHPRLSERAFVLYPLYEIAPDLHIPGKGQLAELVQRCPPAGLLRIDHE
jgi:2-amino-4-hydroxy-6-hydroxymethyldihydropteridine diphosphokinase